MPPKAKGALNMAALANGKVSNKPNKYPKNSKNPKQLDKRKQSEVDEDPRCRGIWIFRIRCAWKDGGCGKGVYRNCLHRIQMFVQINLNRIWFHSLTQAHAMSDHDHCKFSGTKSRNVATLLAATFLPLRNDFGRGDMLISFRTMADVQVNIFLSALYQTPKDELFQRAISFQESLGEELKTHYATDDISRHPDYRAELPLIFDNPHKPTDVVANPVVENYSCGSLCSWSVTHLSMTHLCPADEVSELHGIASDIPDGCIFKHSNHLTEHRSTH